MTLIVNVKESSTGVLLIVTDKEILGKKFEEGKKQLDLTSDFYKGEEKSKEEVKKMITDGIHPSGMKLMPPMPYENYALMTNEDLDALITYLRTIPPHPVSE